MTAKKKVAPKKPKKTVAPRVKLVSYKIGMTIPTDDFANITPEIVVESETMQEGHDYIAPHMNKLWKEYFMIGKRRKEVVPAPQPAPAPVAPVVQPKPVATPPPVVQPKPVVQPAPVAQPAPATSVAMVKATQAIESCMSIDALNLISNQVLISVKLTEADQKILMPMVEVKRTELNAKST